MSIIQTIRDKYARLAVIAVAVALVGFILIDYISGRGSSLFRGGATNLGSVNGRKIDELEFEKKVQMQEQSQQQQGSLGEEGRQQIIAALWKQQVDQILLNDEFDKLGLSVGKKEFADMLYTDPHQLARQYLGNPQNGEYDPNSVRQLINSIRRGKDKNQKDQLNLLLDAIEKARLTEKYQGLVAGTIHYPKWLFEKQNIDNSLMGKISYVSVPFSTISDSAKEIAVSDKEIEDYISKHRDIYKSEDETRTIQYVLFSAAPSSADSAATKKNVLSLKTAFDTAKNVADFVKANSELAYYDSYVSKNKIQIPDKDSIFKTPVGGIYGPYVDKDEFVLAKVIDVKPLPDTVKVRHILIATQEQGQFVREDSTAKKLADSIELAIKGGAKFDSLVVKYSDDQGSKTNGGVYDNVYSGQMVPPFNDFIFNHKVGESGIVKTDFGYHYIEILSQKGNTPAYKVAYLSKKIEASDETERNAENAALQFAGNSRDLKTFDANADKDLKPKGIQKLIAPNINSHAYDIPGIGVSRKFIKDVFDADRGDVLQPERVGNNYVVAAVTAINKAGTFSAASGRNYIEPILKNKKKAEEINKRIGKITTLDAIAALMKQIVQTADSLRFSGSGHSPVSFEHKVLGATFNPANKGKVVPEALDGNSAVYVVRVDDVTATIVENADVAAQQKNLESQGRMKILMSNQYSQFGYGQQYDPAAVLRKAATIKDNRNRFY
ncbi:MAG TPA: peptidylprolyl isomerase [Chitinophagaceae bacterium]|nr:peptidylprolyl isomerase [Chitinophagaceae bacterium]